MQHIDFANAISFLLENGCPSIVYRTKKEILREEISNQEQEYYQNQILQDDNVRHILSLQKDDGWIGGAFHGEDEPESGIRLLREKGVDPDNPVIRQALAAIEAQGEAFDQGCLWHVGKLLDEANLGGSRMIKACVYAYAGIDDTEFLREQIEKALAAFRFVITVHRLEELYEERKGKLVFRAGVPWPGIYHLRLLAFTNSWRNEENRGLLTDALTRLCGFGSIPSINLLHKGQMVGQGSFCMHEFDVNLEELNAKEWMMWFHRMELLARLGVANGVQAFERQIRQLESILRENDGIFNRKLSHYYFNKWTPYTGLTLENSWRKKNARACDLTFRSLLILRLSGESENYFPH